MVKNLSPSATKWLKLFHLVFASLWLTGGISLLLLHFLTPLDAGSQTLKGWHMAMRKVDDFIVIPGAMGCLLTGLLYSSLTNWGWFRHRWITIKWVITVGGILFGTFFLGEWINSLAPLADAHPDNLAETAYPHSRRMLSAWAPLQVASIVFAFFISTLKPWKSGGSKKKLAAVVSCFSLCIVGCDASMESSSIISSSGMVMLKIPGSSMYVSQTEVTVGQYRQVTGTVPEELKDKGDDYPVTFVTSKDAEAFCDILTVLERQSGRIAQSEKYLLPSYDEWLAFADNTPIEGTVTPAGGLGGDNVDSPLPAGTGPKNKFGLYNIRGNVQEWSRDIYESTDSNIVLGACYNTYRKDFLSIKNKAGFMDDDVKDKATGFRCVLHTVE